MVDSITAIDPIAPPAPTTPPFETAANQIARAQAQAAAAHTSEVTFLQDTAKINDETNAEALGRTPTTPPPDNFLNNGLVTLDTSADANADPTIKLLNQLNADTVTPPASKGFNAQQLHDLAILQKDALQLEEATNEVAPIPLGTTASTVDLSVEAQNIVSETNAATAATIAAEAAPPPTQAQLTQAATILQPVANATLTPDLLQEIQAQLAAEQNPLRLSLNSITLAMNFIVGMQPNPTHEIENVTTQDEVEVVTPVPFIDHIDTEENVIDHNRPAHNIAAETTVS